MTNKEAIRVLKSTSVNLGRRGGRTAYAEALELAITALQELDNISDWINANEYIPERGVNVLCKTESGVILIASYGKLYPGNDEEGWISAEFNRFPPNYFSKWKYSDDLNVEVEK